MDPVLIQNILAAILGTGGIAGIFGAWRARKSAKAGQPGDESTARAVSGGPDWEALNRYWQKEMAAVRNEVRALRQELGTVTRAAAKRAESDAARIDQLEEHIYMRRPPPPPPRTKD